MHSKHVRIIGGGIGGLTAALALAHKGVAVDLYEQAVQFEEVGAGIQLSPNALRVLFALGLRAGLEPLVVEPTRIELRDGMQDAPLNHVPIGHRAQRRFGAPYWLIHRADLHRVLLGACQDHGTIELHLNARIDPVLNGAPTIAADGVNSSWRERIRGPSKSTHSGSTAWRVTTKQEAPTDHARVWFGPSAHLVEYPIRVGKECNLVAITKAAQNTAMETAFAKWHPSLRERLFQLNGWTPWPVQTVDPTKGWVKDKLALLGDAAHAMVPFAAQGAAMAIEDAWEIAGCVDANDDFAVAFRQYEHRRRSRVARVWQTAQANGRIYHMTGPAAFARNQVLKLSRPERLLDRVAWIYDWKPTT